MPRPRRERHHGRHGWPSLLAARDAVGRAAQQVSGGCDPRTLRAACRRATPCASPACTPELESLVPSTCCRRMRPPPAGLQLQRLPHAALLCTHAGGGGRTRKPAHFQANRRAAQHRLPSLHSTPRPSQHVGQPWPGVCATCAACTPDSSCGGLLCCACTPTQNPAGQPQRSGRHPAQRGRQRAAGGCALKGAQSRRFERMCARPPPAHLARSHARTHGHPGCAWLPKASVDRDEATAAAAAQLEVKIEGVPLKPDERQQRAIYAPFSEVRARARRNSSWGGGEEQQPERQQPPEPQWGACAVLERPCGVCRRCKRS